MMVCFISDEDDSGTACNGALDDEEAVWRIFSMLLAKFEGRFLAKAGSDDRSGCGSDCWLDMFSMNAVDLLFAGPSVSVPGPSSKCSLNIGAWPYSALSGC